MKTINEKFNTVIRKNTYYFVNQEFEQRYESYISSIRDRLLLLKNNIENDGLKINHFHNLLKEEHGLVALLALTGFSNESFKRILTVIRVLDGKELEDQLLLNGWNKFEQLTLIIKIFKDLKLIQEDRHFEIISKIILHKAEFASFDLDVLRNRNTTVPKELKDDYKVLISRIKKEFPLEKNRLRKIPNEYFDKMVNKIIDYSLSDLSIEIEEWTDDEILFLLKNNQSFLNGVVNLFFKGSTLQTLVTHLPLFELKKLSISKLSFSFEEIIDSLVRYKEKGSYSGNKNNNAETILEFILKKLGVTWETGDLKELVNTETTVKRTMDFIIPSKAKPRIIIESSFLATTSSGQGDKAKTENQVKDLISKYIPKAKFIGFVDGIGWYVRKGDLKRMVTAYEDVFTYHPDELKRFEEFLSENLLEL